MSDSGAPSTSRPYFTGSDRVRDYFIDLEIDARSQPPDIQAYLECIAIEQRHQESPDDPEGDWNRMSSYGPYVLRLDLATQGLNALRHAARTKEHGVWIHPWDITANDMTYTSNYGRNPWLSYLVRTGWVTQAASEAALYPPGPTSSNAVIYGNVRIPYIAGLEDPISCGWLSGTARAYSYCHPVILFPDPSADLIRSLNWYAERIENENHPWLTPDPYLERPFDIGQLIVEEGEMERPSSPSVGHDAWCEKEDRERRERNDE